MHVCMCVCIYFAQAIAVKSRVIGKPLNHSEPTVATCNLLDLLLPLRCCSASLHVVVAAVVAVVQELLQFGFTFLLISNAFGLR